MPAATDTSQVHMINIAIGAADGSGGVWQDPVQTIPIGMNGNPEAFVAAIKSGLPLVNNLRVLFNEFSFNADGSLNPQMQRFLAAAAAKGYELTMCYGSGQAQGIGRNDAANPALTNAQAVSALNANHKVMAEGWAKMLTWMDHHIAVKDKVYGWELMNEAAGYRNTVRANGTQGSLDTASFVELYAKHAIELSKLIQSRSDGHVLVGGWGYNGDFLTLAKTMIGAKTALDHMRDAIGSDLVWSAHLYPGWMGTENIIIPEVLQARLAAIYAPLLGDKILVTEVNIHGTIDNPKNAVDKFDAFAASVNWFANKGIGLGWFPGVQEGAAHLAYIEANGAVTYRHQHSLAHALDAYSLGTAPVAISGAQTITAHLVTARLKNEAYETALGEATFDTAKKAGFAFGYDGDDTIKGTDLSNDFLYGGKGKDNLAGGQGDDFLFGQDGADSINGGSGIDHLFGGLGADSLNGGAGSDVMAGGKGDDLYWVSSAKDMIHEFAAEGIDGIVTTLSSLALISSIPGQFLNVENLAYAGTGDFHGVGNAANNLIVGAAGNDALMGGAGNDNLQGGAGKDSLTGGSGADRLQGGAGADRLDGGLGIDTAVYMAATAGIRANLGANAGLGEAAGDVFVSVENLQGSLFADALYGNGGANYLFGMDGADSLSGGAGNDCLKGGRGADAFVFKLGFAADQVMDFVDNSDRLVISGFGGEKTVSHGLSFAMQIGDDVVFNFGGGDVLTLHHTTKAALTDDMIYI